MKTPKLTPSTIVCIIWLGLGIYLFTRMAFEPDPDPTPVKWTFLKALLGYVFIWVAPLVIGYWAGEENREEEE